MLSIVPVDFAGFDISYIGIPNGSPTQTRSRSVHKRRANRVHADRCRSGNSQRRRQRRLTGFAMRTSLNVTHH